MRVALICKPPTGAEPKLKKLALAFYHRQAESAGVDPLEKIEAHYIKFPGQFATCNFVGNGTPLNMTLHVNEIVTRIDLGINPKPSGKRRAKAPPWLGYYDPHDYNSYRKTGRV
jgi:hypothetical protein